MEKITTNHNCLGLFLVDDEKPQCVFNLKNKNIEIKDITPLIIEYIEKEYEQKVVDIKQGQTPTFFDVKNKNGFLHFIVFIEEVEDVEFIIKPLELYE